MRRQLSKAQGIWPSEDEMVLITGIIIYYVFSLYKTFTSILSFAPGWGRFSGVSGKLSPGWSGGPEAVQGPGGRGQEEQSMEPVPQSPLRPIWRHTQCHVFLQLFPQMIVNVHLGWVLHCRKEQTSCRFLNGTVSLAKHSFLYKL